MIVAVALADPFGCGVNDLPLSMVLSRYEQKAVCILLTLLWSWKIGTKFNSESRERCVGRSRLFYLLQYAENSHYPVLCRDE